MRRSILALVVALVGCKTSGEVTMNQYDTVPAPGVGRGVTLYLGDVELGRSAEVRVNAPNGDLLAVGELERRDELPFGYGGQEYVVIAVWYEDHIVSHDRGKLRVERRARRPRADLVEIEEGGTGRVPKRPDDQLRVGTIEVERAVDVTITFAGGGESRDGYSVGQSRRFERAGAEYSLTLLGVRYERDGVDRAILRFRPGRR